MRDISESLNSMENLYIRGQLDRKKYPVLNIGYK